MTHEILWKKGEFYVEKMHGRWFLKMQGHPSWMAQYIGPPNDTGVLRDWIRKKCEHHIKTADKEISNRSRQVSEAQAKLSMWTSLLAVLQENDK